MKIILHTKSIPINNHYSTNISVFCVILIYRLNYTLYSSLNVFIRRINVVWHRFIYSPRIFCESLLLPLHSWHDDKFLHSQRPRDPERKREREGGRCKQGRRRFKIETSVYGYQKRRGGGCVWARIHGSRRPINRWKIR